MDKGLATINADNEDLRCEQCHDKIPLQEVYIETMGEAFCTRSCQKEYDDDRFFGHRASYKRDHPRMEV